MANVFFYPNIMFSLVFMKVVLALLYNFTSVYTNIPSIRRDESKTSFRLQEGIHVFVYS